VLVESVVYPEIELRICVPAGFEFAPTPAVATSSPSPRSGRASKVPREG
jgi:hypothetical protein